MSREVRTSSASGAAESGIPLVWEPSNGMGVEYVTK